MRPRPPLRFLETDQGAGAPTDDKHRGIRCPKCKWQPRASDRWQCTCRHVWNTFDTRGVCPACAHRWLDTQCLSCLAVSPHEAWYAQEP